MMMRVVGKSRTQKTYCGTLCKVAFLSTLDMKPTVPRQIKISSVRSHAAAFGGGIDVYVYVDVGESKVAGSQVCRSAEIELLVQTSVS